MMIFTFTHHCFYFHPLGTVTGRGKYHVIYLILSVPSLDHSGKWPAIVWCFYFELMVLKALHIHPAAHKLTNQQTRLEFFHYVCTEHTCSTSLNSALKYISVSSSEMMPSCSCYRSWSVWPSAPRELLHMTMSQFKISTLLEAQFFFQLKQRDI